MRRAATTSGLDLFAAYGIDLALAATASGTRTATTDAEYLTLGGFAGPLFSGFVVLGTSESMLRRSNPTPSSSSDWMAELGNQLLGRIKNRLLREGVEIHRVPPAVVKASESSTVSPRTHSRPVALSSGRDNVLIWTELEPSCAPSETSRTGDADVLDEGDMILF